MTQVLIKAELLDGPPDEDGNIRVLIPYSEGTNPAHGRVRFVDPGVVISVDQENMASRSQPVLTPKSAIPEAGDAGGAHGGDIAVIQGRTNGDEITALSAEAARGLASARVAATNDFAAGLAVIDAWIDAAPHSTQRSDPQ